MWSSVAVSTAMCLLGSSVPVRGTTFTVTTVADSGPGSLRQGILDSNAHVGADTIVFARSLAGKTIFVMSGLPVLRGGQLKISGDTNKDGKPDITVSGRSTLRMVGFDIRSSQNEVRGLVLDHFDKAIRISGFGTSGNRVARCYIGTDATGYIRLANNFGVYISSGASMNTVGGVDRTDGNVISGNRGAGVAVVAADQNTVAGNYIGLTESGGEPLGNTVGVLIRDSESCRVGTGASYHRNVISGNAPQEGLEAVPEVRDAVAQWPAASVSSGVCIVGGSGHSVAQNYIGTDATGGSAVGNAGEGVALFNTARVTVGGPYPSNLIQSNATGILADSCRAITIEGNRVGWDVDEAQGNDLGIVLKRCTGGTVVGGSKVLNRGNWIVGNDTGLWAYACPGLKVVGNYVARRRLETLHSAHAPHETPGQLGHSIGMTVDRCTDAVIGGSVGWGNTVCGNAVGVYLTRTNNGRLFGNYIGIDSGATRFDGNGNVTGILVGDGAKDTTIGTTTRGYANAISQNVDGVVVGDLGQGGTWRTSIVGNLIGWSLDGKTRLPNSRNGISVVGNPRTVTIGGDTAAHGNQIAVETAGSAQGQGVAIEPSLNWANSIRVQHNVIGGEPGGMTGAGIRVSSPGVRAADNVVSDLNQGLRCAGLWTEPIVAGNQMSRCYDAVWIDGDAEPRLGDLGNASPTDDGGNVFRNMGRYVIFINNPLGPRHKIMAEGNDWGTKKEAEIIPLLGWAEHDPWIGLVDFDPLIGGEHPQTPRSVSKVHVRGVVAVPAGTGAEVAFWLSAPAEVTVEIANMAGRRVAGLRPIRASAGLNRLSWNGLTGPGTRAPSGLYLVRVQARDAAGSKAAALTSLRLGE